MGLSTLISLNLAEISWCWMGKHSTIEEFESTMTRISPNTTGSWHLTRNRWVPSAMEFKVRNFIAPIWHSSRIRSWVPKRSPKESFESTEQAGIRVAPTLSATSLFAVVVFPEFGNSLQIQRCLHYTYKSHGWTNCLYRKESARGLGKGANFLVTIRSAVSINRIALEAELGAIFAYSTSIINPS